MCLLGQIQHRGRCNLTLLALVDGPDRFPVATRGACFDLDKTESLALQRHDIDLTGLELDISMHHSQALVFEPGDTIILS